MASFGGLWRRKQNWFTRLGKKEIWSGSSRGTSVRPWLEFLEGRALPAIFWDGGGSNSDWETAANWSNDQVPTSTDDVEIGGAVSVELSSGTTVASLRISGGAALNLTDSLWVSGAVRLTESYGSTPGTVRGVSDGVELVAGGGLYFQAGVTLDHLTVKIPEGAQAEVAFATFVNISNGTCVENAGTLKMNGYCGLIDDGTGTLNNAATGRIEATSYYQYFNNLQFATVTNAGEIHAGEGAFLGLGGSGQRVINRGSITGDVNSEIDFADGLDQDLNTGVVETAGRVTFYHTGDQEIAGTFSAASTLVYGDLTLAFTGAVERLGDLSVAGGATVDLTGGAFGAEGRTLSSLTISGGGLLVTDESLTVEGQTQLAGSYGSMPGTVRGVGNGVELFAAGGLYLQAGVNLDHLTVKIPEGTEAEVAFATFVTISNGTRVENAGTLKMNGYCGLIDDGTGTLNNAATGRIEATSYYQYFNNLQFATVTNAGEIHAGEGAFLGLGGSGQRVINRGSITGDVNSEIDFADGLDQDLNTGVVETAGRVTFYHTGDQEIAGTFSAASTLVYGDLTLAFTGAVERLGDLSVAGGATVDLTGAAFGAEGRTLSSLTISGGGLLVTDESLTVEGQTQLAGSYGSMPGTVRGVGNGVELFAAGGLYLQAGVNLDHLTVKIPEGTEAEVAFATFVNISNGTRVENAGTLKMNGYCGLIDDGTGTLNNAATGRIEATSYYQYFNNLQFATVTNAGEIHAGEGAFLGLGGSGQRVINRGSITGDVNSEIDFADGLDQDLNTGVVETAGRVTFYHTGDQEIAGTFSAAGTLVYGDLTLAFTGAVERLGDLSVAGGATVDLTGAAFGAEGRTLSSLTISGGGLLVTDESLTVEGQTQLAGSYGSMPGTVRGVGNGVELFAAGGLYLQAGVNLDHLTVKIPEGTEAEVAFATFVTISNGTRVENAGTLKMNGYCGLIDDGTGTLNNAATGRIEATSYYQYFNNLQFATVTNAGEIHAGEGAFLGLGGSGQRVINRGSITGDVNSEIDFADGLDQDLNTGVVETAGRVTFYHTGDQEIAGTFSAAGTLVYGDLTLAFTGAVERLGDLSVAGGATVDLTGAAFGAEGRTLSSLTLSGGGILITDENLTVEGLFNWDHGTLQGDMGLGSLTVQSDMTLSGTYTVRDFNLINAGDALWTGGSVQFFGASRFTNLAAATFDDQVDGNFGGIDSCPIFDNQGLFRKSGGPGTTLLHMQLYNSGSVLIEQGTLNIHCGYVQVVNNDGSGGEIGGDFTGDVSVYNPGQITVEPQESGNPPAPVSNYIQGATGNLTERIGGLAPGTQYGQIIVNGNVNLDGTLQVQLINGFVPSTGNAFIVIDNRGANPIMGTFIGLPEGAAVWSGLYRFNVSYVGGDGNDLALTFAGVADGELGGRVFEDRNASGQQDLGELGLDGVTVTLTGTNILGSPVSAATTTDSSGNYRFVHLFPGTYAVTFVRPAGFNTTDQDIGADGTDSDASIVTGSTGNYLLQPGERNVTVDAGYYQFASVGDFVWYDANNNGKQDVGEAGIANVKVQLFRAAGTQVGAEQYTDASGKYLFTNLVPGDYSLTFTTPAGYSAVLKDQGDSDSADSDADPVTGKTAAFTLISGQSDLTWDAGYSKKGSISGVSYKDVTGNGLTSDDMALLTPFTIQLYRDSDNDGVLDMGNANASLNDALVMTTSTSPVNGAYAFSGLAPGTYFVREVAPSGWMRTAPALTDYYKVAVTTSESTGKDFASFEECHTGGLIINYISVGGTILTDASGNKIKDLRGNTNQGDEVTVNFTLTNATGANALLTLVSYTAPGSTFVAKDAYKQEIFDTDSRTFGSGTYSMTVQNPNAFYQIDFVWGLAIDRFGPEGSNVFYTPQNRLISADNDGRNAYLAVPASLAGAVYSDRDNDGSRDAGEEGIAGAKVTLTGKDALGNALTLVRTTRPDGSYSFAGLPASDGNGYKLTQTQPGDYNDGKETVGKVNGTALGSKSANDVLSAIKLAAGQSGIDYLFGELSKSSLSGFVYKDANNNGQKDAGEIGIKNASILLTGYDDKGASVNITVVTDSSGKYSFTGLRPSDSNGYTVKETSPSGYKDGKDTLGRVNGTVVGTMGDDKFTGVLIKAGEDAIDYLFGELPK